MMNKLRKVILIAIVGLIGSSSYAQDGLEIAKAADRYDQGFENSTSKLTMKLTNKHGQESTRYLHNQTLEQTEDGDKSLIVFDSPKDVEGTATLTFTHKEIADDQWLYLPALKRVKRISSDNKSGPFMGSEFAYEDLSSQEVEKYTYKFIKEEKINGVTSYVVERYPVDPKSGYTRQIVWYNKENYRIEKTEYYDRKDTKLKTLTFAKYQVFFDKHWRAGEMLMINHQTNKQTKLIFENYAFKTGLTDTDFSQNSLKRAGN
jgi:outer membrane lipoprotein-sorting protein